MWRTRNPLWGFCSTKCVSCPTIENKRNIPKGEKDAKLRINGTHEREPESKPKSKGHEGRKTEKNGRKGGLRRVHFRLNQEKPAITAKMPPVLARLDPL